MDVTVVVATFGDTAWKDLAAQRAVPSARAEGIPVLAVHADTLHDARNCGLGRVDSEWVCFLDADDELEPGYFAAMAAGEADVRAPSVRYLRDGRHAAPRMPQVAGHHHICTADCLQYGNWLVIGSLVRADMARQVGGFADFPWSEDWDLWVKCWHAGATFEQVPTAVYRAHVRADSRNRGQSREAKLAAHRAIAEANGLPIPA